MVLRELLTAETPASGAGVDPARITRAAGRLLPGASCDRDDHTKVMFAQLRSFGNASHEQAPCGRGGHGHLVPHGAAIVLSR